MIFAVNVVFEGCSDTDIFLVDTSKLDPAVEAKFLNAHKNPNPGWVTINDPEDYEPGVVKTSRKSFPIQIDGLITIYIE